MAEGITSARLSKSAVSGALKGAEWMAENAYIAPGFHRLFTAGGLTAGLYGGRKLMDVLTARNATNGEEIPSSQINEFMRPLHGFMRYNPYSDHAADRWKFVIDKLAPVTVGAVGAYFGGRYFVNGHWPNKEPFFPAGEATNLAIAAKRYSSEITDSAMRIFNADAIRKWAAFVFEEGSSTGQHIFGALWPFNNGMAAVSFQELAQRNIYVPGAPWLNRFFGNYGGTSRGMFAAMRETAKWMGANILRDVPVESWATPEALHIRALDGLQLYPSQSKQFASRLADAYKDLIHNAKAQVALFKAANPAAKDGDIAQHVQNFISGKIDPQVGLHGYAHDYLLHHLGVDLTDTGIAQGPFKQFGRIFGAHKKQIADLEEHANYLKQKFDYNIDPAKWAEDQLHTPPWKMAAIYGGAGIAIAGSLGTAAAVGVKLHSHSNRAHKPHILDQASLAQHLQPAGGEKPKHEGNLIDWINDKPLSVAHWVSRVVIVPPSMHRFMNAAYLSAALYVGMKGSNILTGRVLSKVNNGKFMAMKGGELLSIKNGIGTFAKAGEIIPESLLPAERVWKPLQSFHGLMAYTPGSAATADRWKQAAHHIMPVGLGMVGTWTGSHLYFRDRIRNQQNPQTLEDYADRISFEQSKPYGFATAITSIFNTGSGIHLLPVFNYSANLHNRYLLGSGQQVATPGIGKWWSGNAGTTPWGVKLTLTQLTNYLSYNDEARPKELRSLVHSLIGKLYPTLNDADLLAKKQVMLDRIHDVRDSYLVEGVVPPSKRAALGEAMHQLLSGQGFEALLQESGLDPASANLASNGASGKIANFLGSKKAVEKLSHDYKAKFAERTAMSDASKPSDYLKSLLDQGSAKSTKLAERVKAEANSYPVMGA